MSPVPENNMWSKAAGVLNFIINSNLSQKAWSVLMYVVYLLLDVSGMKTKKAP